MANIHAAIVKFFEDEDWPYSELDGGKSLRSGFQGDNGEWTCYVHIREEQGQLLFYSVCPVSAPPEKRMEIAEFITRANYGLVLGAFEMDFSDGEIRYRSGVGVEGEELTHAYIRPIVYANVLTMDKYLSGIMKVIYGDTAPERAVERASRVRLEKGQVED